MYTIGRDEAAEKLGVSTRSIDRYIRSNKLRAKKQGKIVMIHEQDLEILQHGGIQESYEIVGTSSQAPRESAVSTIVNEDILDILTQKMEEKDSLIQELSYKIGKFESELKNSVPLLEYRKQTLLLENSKTSSLNETQKLKEKAIILERRFSNERTMNIVLMVAVFLLLVLGFLIWYKYNVLPI